MYFDLKELLKGEQIYERNCIGKTVKDIYFIHGQYCIVFDDRTFCLMEDYTDIDGEVVIENVPINESNASDDIRYDAHLNEFSFSGIMKFLIKNKLFNKSELINKFQPMKERELERIKNREILEYERIKEKYNLK